MVELAPLPRALARVVLRAVAVLYAACFLVLASVAIGLVCEASGRASAQSQLLTWMFGTAFLGIGIGLVGFVTIWLLNWPAVVIPPAFREDKGSLMVIIDRLQRR